MDYEVINEIIKESLPYSFFMINDKKDNNKVSITNRNVLWILQKSKLDSTGLFKVRDVSNEVRSINIPTKGYKEAVDTGLIVYRDNEVAVSIESKDKEKVIYVPLWQLRGFGVEATYKVRTELDAVKVYEKGKFVGLIMPFAPDFVKNVILKKEDKKI